MPRESAFYLLLEKIAIKSHESVKLFKELIDSWEPSHPTIQRLRDLEHECDLIVHEIMDKLNHTFVTPIDREDIQRLTKKIDDLVDTIKGLAERMVLFKIETVTDELKEMASILENEATIVVTIVRGIRDLKNSKDILGACAQIQSLEHQGDRVFEKALGMLFQNGMPPLEVIKWKEIYDFSEQAIDICEDIADLIWGIVVKYG